MLSAYERQRAENIARNKEMLAALGLDGGGLTSAASSKGRVPAPRRPKEMIQPVVRPQRPKRSPEWYGLESGTTIGHQLSSKPHRAEEMSVKILHPKNVRLALDRIIRAIEREHEVPMGVRTAVERMIGSIEREHLEPRPSAIRRKVEPLLPLPKQRCSTCGMFRRGHVCPGFMVARTPSESNSGSLSSMPHVECPDEITSNSAGGSQRGKRKVEYDDDEGEGQEGDEEEDEKDEEEDEDEDEEEEENEECLEEKESGGHGQGLCVVASSRGQRAIHKQQGREHARRTLASVGLPCTPVAEEETLEPIASMRTSSGYFGVYPDARRRCWQAQVNHVSLGLFETAWLAGCAVTRALRSAASQPDWCGGGDDEEEDEEEDDDDDDAMELVEVVTRTTAKQPMAQTAKRPKAQTSRSIQRKRTTQWTSQWTWLPTTSRYLSVAPRPPEGLSLDDTREASTAKRQRLDPDATIDATAIDAALWAGAAAEGWSIEAKIGGGAGHCWVYVSPLGQRYSTLYYVKCKFGPKAPAAAASKSPAEGCRPPASGRDLPTATEEEGERGESCQVCGVSSWVEGNELLLCDSCPKVLHLQCLTPPIYTVPVGDWFCPSCAAATSPPDAALAAGAMASATSSAAASAAGSAAGPEAFAPALTSTADTSVAAASSFSAAASAASGPPKPVARRRWPVAVGPRAQPTRFAKVRHGFEAFQARIGKKFQAHVIPLARWSPPEDTGAPWVECHEPLLVQTERIAQEVMKNRRRGHRTSSNSVESLSQEQYEYIDDRYLTMGNARALSPTAASLAGSDTKEREERPMLEAMRHEERSAVSEPTQEPLKVDAARATAAAEGLELLPSSSNETGFRGVRKHGGKYQAKIKVNGNTRHLGTFATPGEAALCYARHIGMERRAVAAPGEEDGDEGEEAAASKAQNFRSMAHHKAEIDKLEQQQLPQGMSPVRDSSAPPNGWQWPLVGDTVEVEVAASEDAPAVWATAEVIAVLVDGTFQARIVLPDGSDQWEDWFSWQEEGSDWRRQVRTEPCDEGAGVQRASLSADEIDARLWVGASAAGWAVYRRSGDGHYRYVSPDGTVHTSRSAVGETVKKSRPRCNTETKATAPVCVEVQMQDEGLVGSKYAATLLRWRGAAWRSEAFVEYDEFEADDDSLDDGATPEAKGTLSPRKLREWVPASAIASPPSPPVAGWLRRLHVGNEVEAFHEGGWWSVRIISRRAASVRLGEEPQFVVEAVGYGIQRTVGAANLRPCAVH